MNLEKLGIIPIELREDIEGYVFYRRIDNGTAISSNTIKFIPVPPVFVTKTYRQYKIKQKSEIPEEANAIILGEMKARGNSLEYSAAYCHVDFEDKRNNSELVPGIEVRTLVR